jgi:[ribosomal protein S5]-alanine N-acetyltransferase
MIDYDYGVALGPLESKYTFIKHWRNNPKVWKWCRQNDLISDAQQQKWFENQSNDPTIKMYMVWSSESETVGVCGFTSIDMLNRRAEFSLYISPEHHCKGLGKKALKTLVHHGFRNLGFQSIWGESFDGNPAMKMFEQVGFVKEGVRRNFYFRDGRFIDAHLYSLQVYEWISLRK